MANGALDWIGNSSFYNTNHRKKDSEVSSDDFYATHPNSVRSFLQVFTIPRDAVIWEPACGTGNISRILKEKEFEVISTDLRNRGYGEGQLDFLEVNKLLREDISVIMTNPPYKYTEKFVEKSLQLLSLQDLCIMFLKLTFLEGQKRYQLFQKYPPREIYVHSSRQGCSPKGKFDFANTGAACFAWFIWEKGFRGDPVIKWIKPN